MVRVLASRGLVRSFQAAVFAALLAGAIILAAPGTAAGAKPAGKGKQGAGDAKGSARLIVSPRPGQRIRGDRVRIVVRAGAEPEDLKARLNGERIGGRFGANPRRHRRQLDATPIDGLRRGGNTLTIRVHDLRHGGYRRASVRFFVAHHRPLASAGRDIRVVAGSRLELHGMLKLDRSDSGARGVQWQVVGAPRRSALSNKPAANAAARAAERSALGERRTLTPTFRPDVRGHYKVKLTIESGSGKSVDWANIYAVPTSPLINLRTEVPASAQQPQPGVFVGGEVIPAPFMREARPPYAREANPTGTYAGKAGNVTYVAMAQVVAFERTTLAFKWNRTYGICTVPGDYYPCRNGPKGEPIDADPTKELAELGPSTLVVAASHPSGATPGLAWGSPADFGFFSAFLGGIGMPTPETSPTSAAELAAAKPGEMSGVGVPGLDPGDAKYILGGGQTGMVGYLTPDSHTPKFFFFIPRQREPFDTRAATSCNANGCTVAQKVGANEVTATVAAGKGGFLVSGFDRRTLAPIEHALFTTAGGQPESGENSTGEFGPREMSRKVEALAKQGALVVVTSVHGQSPGVLFTPGASKTPWNALIAAIVSIGGTREGLNTAATSAGGDYSLVGWSGLGEGAGDEQSVAGARLRGVLVPGDQSVFEPQAVLSGASMDEPELLIQTLLREPSQAWWGDGNREAEAAIVAIGAQSSLLGYDPRPAYWTQLTTPLVASTALEQVKGAKFPAALGEPKFTEAVFNKAKEELAHEVEGVKKVRTYMEELATPARHSGTIAWEEATKLSAELEERIKALKEQGEVSAEWLAIIEGVLEGVSTLLELKPIKSFMDLTHYVALAAVAAELGQTIWNANYQGTSKEPSIQVEALRLGSELQAQAEANINTFHRMGDIIVSDPTKLAEIKWGGCNPTDDGCPAKFEELGFNEELEKFADLTMKRAFQREIYERLLPLAYPILDLGLTKRKETIFPANAAPCTDFSEPLKGAPALSYHKSLWEIDPETGAEYWRVYLSVARKEREYGWASQAMLKPLFGKVEFEPGEENSPNLEADPGHFMRQGIAIKEYKNTWKCEMVPPDEAFPPAWGRRSIRSNL